ncbi:MAG TPA: hypothetical protein VGB89_09545 [Bacteroidota bacterium]
MKARTATILLLSFVFYTSLLGQGSAGSSGNLEPRTIVDMPTAGMLASGSYGLDFDFFQDGGLLLNFSVGALDWFSIGASYGGSGIIGSGTPNMNPFPGFSLKLRPIEESILLPALVIGFDSQGKEGYVDSLDRYIIKSPGVFLVASKNYDLLGYISFHVGLNYSFERKDGNRDVNGYLGVEKTIGPALSLLVEYNLGINDSHGRAIGDGKGYLNTAIKWTVGGGLTLGFTIKDLTKNGVDKSVGSRTIRIEYARFF